jgi:hypothetical protein
MGRPRRDIRSSSPSVLSANRTVGLLDDIFESVYSLLYSILLLQNEIAGTNCCCLRKKALYIFRQRSLGGSPSESLVLMYLYSAATTSPFIKR